MGSVLQHLKRQQHKYPVDNKVQLQQAVMMYRMHLRWGRCYLRLHKRLWKAFQCMCTLLLHTAGFVQPNTCILLVSRSEESDHMNHRAHGFSRHAPLWWWCLSPQLGSIWRCSPILTWAVCNSSLGAWMRGQTPCVWHDVDSLQPFLNMHCRVLSYGQQRPMCYWVNITWKGLVNLSVPSLDASWAQIGNTNVRDMSGIWKTEVHLQGCGYDASALQNCTAAYDASALHIYTAAIEDANQILLLLIKTITLCCAQLMWKTFVAQTLTMQKGWLTAKQFCCSCNSMALNCWQDTSDLPWNWCYFSAAIACIITLYNMIMYHIWSCHISIQLRMKPAPSLGSGICDSYQYLDAIPPVLQFCITLSQAFRSCQFDFDCKTGADQSCMSALLRWILTVLLVSALHSPLKQHSGCCQSESCLAAVLL